MTSLCQCYLEGVSPSDLSPAAVVLDIREHPADAELAGLAIAGREGTRLTRQRREALRVSVDIEIHEPDPARRKEVCRQLARWAAGGGWLAISDRPGQRLRVSCDAPPVVTSALRWTQALTVTFTAWDRPWWEETAPASVRGAGAAGTLTLRPGGDRPTVLEATLLNAGERPVTAVSLACGGRQLRLAGLALAPGEALSLTYDERALMRLTAGGRSALHLRDPDSADDLWLTPRRDNAIAWQADGPVTAVFTARGRCL